MEFRVARAARVTGARIEEAVRVELKRLKIVEPDCVVCYGVGYAGPKRALNARCSAMDKMEQGQTLSKALGAEALKIFTSLEDAHNHQARGKQNMVIARRIKHTKGKDIRVCKTFLGAKVANKNHDFFTAFVESDTEFRVFVYRKRTLCAYEKRLTEPEKNMKFGRNRENGWTFHALAHEEIPESLRRAALTAVRCLNLDFGAVDILGTWDKDHQDITPTVLEVNSAPGFSDDHRTGFVKLVTRIVKWIKNECPERGE